MIVLQKHHDFVKTAEDVLTLHRLIASDWFGRNVDCGRLRMGDPYAEIAKLAPYAYTWLGIGDAREKVRRFLDDVSRRTCLTAPPVPLIIRPFPVRSSDRVHP